MINKLISYIYNCVLILGCFGVCFAAVHGICNNVGDAERDEIEEEQAQEKVSPKREKQYFVSPNVTANEIIKIFKEKGLHIVSIEALSAPSGQFGYYDVLITYE